MFQTHRPDQSMDGDLLSMLNYIGVVDVNDEWVPVHANQFDLAEVVLQV